MKKNLFDLIQGISMKDSTMTLELKAPKAKDIKKIDTLDGEKLLKLLKEKAKESKEHFEDGGWDIWTSQDVGDIMCDVFGFHLEDVITAFIAEKAGSNIAYKDHSPMFTKKGGYFPVFYDEYTGEIIVVEDGDNKEYINKFSPKNGYESLGCL